MAVGLNKTLGVLERQLYLRRKSEKSGGQKDGSRYETDTTAMEIVNSYSHLPSQPRRLHSLNVTSAYSISRSPTPQPPASTLTVFDSHAKVTTHILLDHTSPGPQFHLPLRKLTPTQRRELKSLPFFGNPHSEATIFESIPDYPPMKPPREDYTLVIPSTGCLRFDSHFESGNLRKAVKMTEDEYQLLLDFDTETQGHTQWYYFSVRNERENHTVTMKIVNMGKRSSLYQHGLRPLVYSVAKATQLGLGWHRDGVGVTYGPSSWSCEGTQTKYYQLSFRYTFRYAQDIVYFAHCYPYTYTDLSRQLDVYRSTPRIESILRVDTLCYTIGHNACPVLTITEDVERLPSWSKELELMNKSSAGRKLTRYKGVRKPKEGR